LDFCCNIYSYLLKTRMHTITHVLSFCLLCIGVQGRWVAEMENKDLFEGDIALTADQKSSLESQKASYASITTNLWPKNGQYVEVAYLVTSTLANDKIFSDALRDAISDYEKYTCIRFKPRTNERQYLYIIKGNGCSSPVGTRGATRSNRISIGEGCQSKATIIHEVAHSLGFYHEQSRPDRDQYLKIHLENVPQSWQHNFDKHRSGEIDSLGTKFDYRSVMHYGKTAFGEGKLTLETKDPYYTNLIGAASGFSEIDINQFNKLYRCPAYTGPLPTRLQTPDCYDIDSYCEFRVIRDKGCTDQLKKLCPFTCNQCLVGPTKTPASPQPTNKPTNEPTNKPTKQPQQCRDIRKDCAAKKKFCAKRKQFRNKCKRTCKVCT